MGYLMCTRTGDAADRRVPDVRRRYPRLVHLLCDPRLQHRLCGSCGHPMSLHGRRGQGACRHGFSRIALHLGLEQSESCSCKRFRAGPSTREESGR
jgi:hypothetical protein